jgi:hypothetical protein
MCSADSITMATIFLCASSRRRQAMAWVPRVGLGTLGWEDEDTATPVIYTPIAKSEQGKREARSPGGVVGILLRRHWGDEPDRCGLRVSGAWWEGQRTSPTSQCMGVEKGRRGADARARPVGARWTCATEWVPGARVRPVSARTHGAKVGSRRVCELGWWRVCELGVGWGKGGFRPKRRDAILIFFLSIFFSISNLKYSTQI